MEHNDIELYWDNNNESVKPNHHILGDTDIDTIKMYAKDSKYEQILSKKIKNICSLCAYSVLLGSIYYYYTNESQHYTTTQNIINALLGFFIINIGFGLGERLISVLIRKIILKKHIKAINKRRFIYLEDKKVQYDLIKSLAYLHKPEEGTDPHYIKENFITYRNRLLMYLKMESYDNFINTYLETYNYSKKHIAYTSNIECDESYYHELKSINLENNI